MLEYVSLELEYATVLTDVCMYLYRHINKELHSLMQDKYCDCIHAGHATYNHSSM